MDKPKIAILTFCVGADYKRAMEPGLQSKRTYAAKHGYAFHEGGEDVWDRTRPIPWSKFNFILKYLDEYDYIFWSDADAIILNQDLLLETQVLPLLPAGKDLLWTKDACDNLNNGHLLIRGRTPWIRDFFRRAYEQHDLIHHMWWDNAAMMKLFLSIPSDAAKIETCHDHWLFNAYLFGSKNSASDPTTRLYKHDDFLLHFAGVYDIWNIHRMMLYVQKQAAEKKPLDLGMLDVWRMNPPLNKTQAIESLPS